MAKHFGYWVFGSDMTTVNLETMKKYGVTDIFLNFYALEKHGKSSVESWIKKAKTQGINVHLWVQCFYNGDWINPKTTNLTSKLNEIKKYAALEGLTGIHLDYLRYPGNAYKTSGGADAITAFVKKVRSQNPKTFLSCAVMPENDDCKYYYGQDIPALGKIVDCILPMQYKGNYEAGSSWLASTTKYFSKYATVWSGLQTYKSDDDPTVLSSSELLSDCKTCLNNGASGVILFRYGLVSTINFKSLVPSNTNTNSGSGSKISATDIKNLAVAVKKYIETNKKLPSAVTVNGKKYTWPQMAYIFSFAVNNPGKALSLISVKAAEKSSGDTVNEKIYTDDYKDIAKRTYNWIKSNKQCPNYASTKKSKKHLRPRVFIYMMARIIVYYYAHDKTLPKYATVNSKYFK